MARIWFVTGSSRGLGLALVEAALESGDSVAATARKPEQLKHLVEKYGSDRILPLALDVTNSAQVQMAVQNALRRFGHLDIVVNNAGFAHCVSIEDSSLEVFREQFETNFFGIVNVTKAILPALREQGRGHIMQVSSVGGRLGTPGMGSYQSAKWAMGGFSSVLAAEVGPLGIKVTVLEPGGMKTDWAGSSATYGPISEPYQKTVGLWPERVKYILNETNDVQIVAKVILHVSRVADPPFRLLLGPETVPLAKDASEKLAKSDEKWRRATLLSID